MPHYNGLTKLSILVCILTDISSHVRQFYGSFNNVIVKGRETWTLNDQSINRVNVAQNNSFRHIFSRFWREIVKPLQYMYFFQTLSISYFIDQRKLLFSRKLATHNNSFLLSLSRLVQNRLYAIGSVYGCTTFLIQLVKSSRSFPLSLQRQYESFVMYV